MTSIVRIGLVYVIHCEGRGYMVYFSAPIKILATAL